MRIDTTEMPTADLIEGSNAARKPRPMGPEESPLAVLVLDDNAEVREMIAASLREAGCVVEVAEGPQHARDLLDARPFDAAVIDLVMPGVQGLDVLRELRGLKFGKDLPAMVLSVLPDGAARAQIRGQVRDAGHATLVDKPVTKATLVASLYRLVPAKG
jgi:CheY-like chemotaxis protein